METKERIKPIEIIELVKRLPDADDHIFEDEGKQCITDEWLVGRFAGRSFEQDTLEEAAEEMIDYFYEHINHKSIVGLVVTNSGFPDLKKVERFCLKYLDDDKQNLQRIMHGYGITHA